MGMRKLLLILLFPTLVSAQSPLKMLIRKTPVAFVPTDISGLKFWVKADQIGGLSDGDPVSTWSDQSGVSNDVTASSTARPLYKIGIQNGKPILRFDGSNDAMAKASFSGIDGLSGMTIFIVVKQTSLATNNIYLSKWNYNTQGSFAWQTGSVTNTEMTAYVANAVNDVGGNNTSSTDAGLTANFFLLEMVYDGSQGTAANRVKFYKNTTALTMSMTGTLPTALTTSTADFVLGSFTGSLTRYFTGDMGEVLVYNSTLSGTDRAKVEAYLNSRWALY